MGADSIATADLTEASEKWRSDLQELGQLVSGIDASPEFCSELANLERSIEEERGEFNAIDFISKFYRPRRSKIWESEEFHSNLLAWLLNPSKRHGLGERFLKGFLESTLAPDELLNGDWSQATVVREWRNSVRDETGDDETAEDETGEDETGNDGNREEKIGSLDLLVISRYAKFLCAIENKVFSSEHSEQLTRYRRALESRYGDFEWHLVFLTPEGIDPKTLEERNNWKSIGYSTVQQLVQELVDDPSASVTEEVRAFLKQYAATLRRNIVPESSTKQRARKLYLEHRALFDQVFQSQPNYQDELKRRLRDVLADQSGLKLLEEKQNDYVAFIPTEWEKLCAQQTSADERYPLVYFGFYIGRDRLILNAWVGRGKDRSIREEVVEAVKQHPQVFQDRIYHETDIEFQDRHVRLYRRKYDLTDEDYCNWDDPDVTAKIKRWVSDFVKDELSQMREIIGVCLRGYQPEESVP